MVIVFSPNPFVLPLKHFQHEAAVVNVWSALAVIAYSSDMAKGDRAGNSEANINKITLNYIHASFPVNPLCVAR